MRWMKTIIFSLVILIPLLTFGQTISELEESDYKNAIAKYFEHDFAQVENMAAKGFSLEEVPVIIFSAQKTKLTTDNIIALYKGGQSWQNIIENNNANLNDFYFSISSQFKSKTYLPIFNKFKAFNSKAKGSADLSDKEIIDMVNLQFVTKHYDFNVFEIMAMRDYGKKFSRINADVKLVKEKLHNAELAKERKAAKAKKEASE